MSTELRVILPGSESSADARHAVKLLDKVLTLLGHLETVTHAGRSPRGQHSTWAFTDLALGSVCATFAPSKLGSGMKPDALDEVMRRTVDGFADAEKQQGVPEGWDIDSASVAAEIARLLGLLPATGMVLELLKNRNPVRSVTVTRRSEEHLRAALRTRHLSIGSVVGRIESISVHDQHEAGLWPDAGGGRIAVKFTAAQRDDVRDAFGRRVEVIGALERNAAGRVMSIRLRGIDVLPESSPPLTDLVGLDPNLTGGKDAVEYLKEIRGAA